MGWFTHQHINNLHDQIGEVRNQQHRLLQIQQVTLARLDNLETVLREVILEMERSETTWVNYFRIRPRTHSATLPPPKAYPGAPSCSSLPAFCRPPRRCSTLAHFRHRCSQGQNPPLSADAPSSVWSISNRNILRT
jgi:hypothetical protein